MLNRQQKKPKLSKVHPSNSFINNFKTIAMSFQLNIYISTTIACLFIVAGCQSNASYQDTTAAKQTAVAPSSAIEGAWELVWSESNGKVNNSGKPIQLKIFCNGFFCYLMQNSSTGNWSEGGGGTYETDGKTYKEIHKYNSNAENVGFTDWQEFEIKGDTLYMTLFKKALNRKGEDVTAQWPRIVEKRVRAKKS